MQNGISAEHYRRRLQGIRRRLLQRIERMGEAGLDLPMQETTSELSSYDNHPGDLGSEVFERSKDFALQEQAAITLRQVEEALDRLAQGRYDRCAECGQPIDKERLDALPYATLCIHCQQEVEASIDRHKRPIEEDVIVPPFGGVTHDDDPRFLFDSEDEQMYDGEDAWQDVARTQEHSERSMAGSYYGGSDLDEDRGYADWIDKIPYYKGADGMFYADVRGLDDEDAPRERLVGDEGVDQAGVDPRAGA